MDLALIEEVVTTQTVTAIKVKVKLVWEIENQMVRMVIVFVNRVCVIPGIHNVVSIAMDL